MRREIQVHCGTRMLCLQSQEKAINFIPGCHKSITLSNLQLDLLNDLNVEKYIILI